MELRHLRYFIAVAEELSFTRAAQRLHTSQPSLSQQIIHLEEEIGFPLLERTKRRVELTEVGKVFLTEARQALMQVDNAVTRARRAGRQTEHTLKICFVPSAEIRIFPSILPELRMHYPTLNISLHSLINDEQEPALLRGDIDVAFLRPPLKSAELVTHLVYTEPLQVFLPASHPLSAMRRITPQMLDGEPRIASDPAFTRPLFDLVETFLERHGVRSPIVQQASNILLNVNLVGAGIGYALLPAYAATMAGHSVCVRQFESQAPEIDLIMAYRANNPSPLLPTLRQLVCPDNGNDRFHIPPQGSAGTTDRAALPRGPRPV